MSISIIRPDSTVSTNHGVIGGAGAHNALNDPIIQPAVEDSPADYIYGATGVTHVTMQDPPSGSHIKSVLWARGHGGVSAPDPSGGPGALGSSILVALRKGTTTLCSVNFERDTALRWLSCLYEGVLTPAEMSDLNLLLTSTSPDPSDTNTDESYVYTAYAEIETRGGLRMVV